MIEQKIIKTLKYPQMYFMPNLIPACLKGLRQPFCRCVALSMLLVGGLRLTAAPVSLLTDYLHNPLGIDDSRPRLSWTDDSRGYGVAQRSYRIVVGTDSANVAAGRGDMWDTGNVASASQRADYAGKSLQPFTRYYWRVETVTGGRGPKSSPVASFEMGLMQPGTFQGCWISDRHFTAFRPAPYFRKEFRVARRIVRARAYITSAGPYELSLNGSRVGDHFLDPAYTTYNKRLLYTTYDVTSCLRTGDNAIGVVLGNSWYNHQAHAVWGFENAEWRRRPGFCMDLRICYDDGAVETVSTDGTWTTSTGPLVYNNIYTGEHYDFTLGHAGWNLPGGGAGWEPAVARDFPTRNIVAQAMPPIRATRDLAPVKVTRLSDTDCLFDFGQNMSGTATIRLQGPRGTKVVVRYGEKLLPNGHLDQANIDYFYRGDSINDPFQGDVFILSGSQDEFTNMFSYKGFRYAEVRSSQPLSWTSDALTAHFVHSDVQRVGTVSPASEMVTGLAHATDYSYLSNLMGYPTDCPQREKNGWTGDAHLACQTGLYSFDGIAVYEKWMADHRDTQRGGLLPDIIPTDGWGFGERNLIDWSSTIVLIPWNLYLFYGDTRCLADCYQNMKDYVDFIDECNPSHVTSWGRGDWVPVKTQSNVEFTSSIYYYTDVRLLSRVAAVLGHADDAARYAALAASIREAVNAKFLHCDTGLYADGTMTELSMPLYWGLVPDTMRQRVADALARNVRAHDGHIDCGILGTKVVLNALSENGYADLAYAMATKDTYPSWGYWLRRGQTTLTENWNIDQGRDASYNHIMYGEIGAWFYKGLAGIFPDDRQPGFAHVRLRPHFVRQEPHFGARHTSPYGEIVSEWRWKDAKTVEYTAVVPANSTATLTLDRSDIASVAVAAGRRHVSSPRLSNDGYSCELPSGRYVFTVRLR